MTDDAVVATLRKEIEALNQWIADLQAGMYVNCVYCGHRYGPSATAPVSQADALKAHIAVCPKHPMHEVLKALVEGRDLVWSLIAHVSHGGPSRTDAEQWVGKADKAIAHAKGRSA